MHEGYLPILFGVLSCSGGRSNELSAWEAVEEDVCHNIHCQRNITVYIFNKHTFKEPTGTAMTRIKVRYDLLTFR